MNYEILNSIDQPKDLKDLSPESMQILAKELRHFIINMVATKEGHLGASLGVVELSIALHRVFDTPKDQLIWDVGHQAYVHKILTGRKDLFHTNRQFGGLAGFPKRDESIYDAFGTGHSSTSISAALGMALASQIKGELDQTHIAVIGDASIASGMAFEALNHAGVSRANLLIILNDNEMGIDPNVGAFKEYLTRMKNGAEKGLSNIFDNFNIDYTGPIDGHDLETLNDELERLKDLRGPRLLHIITTKGKGLKSAEKDQTTFHAPGKFNPETGELIKRENPSNFTKYQDVFGKTLVELAEHNSKLIGITPAMPTGSSLKEFIETYPERAFDVGISEQHALTLAAGMATQGLLPVVAIYSTFLQRAYDQLIHDIALQNLPVILAVDRAGLVGEDGPTHHGVFDLSYLRNIPNLKVFAPCSGESLRNILYTASLGLDGPIAIRYPRGYAPDENWKKPFKISPLNQITALQSGTEIAIIAIGSVLSECKEAISSIARDKQKQISLYALEGIKPLNHLKLESIWQNHRTIISVEDNVLSGGVGSALLEIQSEFNNNNSPEFITLGIPDKFISHGPTKILKKSINLDIESLVELINTKL
ncbi:MAG: 1-deoxy-D-xylulose-5-phosphate synthase [Flavobacteriaceae bacterium]